MRIRLAVPSVTPKSVAEKAPGPQSTSKVVLVPGADGSGDTRRGQLIGGRRDRSRPEVAAGSKCAVRPAPLPASQADADTCRRDDGLDESASNPPGASRPIGRPCAKSSPRSTTDRPAPLHSRVSRRHRRKRRTAPFADTPALRPLGERPGSVSWSGQFSDGSKRGQLFQAAQVVAGQQQVDVRRRDHHAERARPEVAVVALVRVHPDDPVAQPGQPLHRRASTAGSPRSRPSEQITTMPPRHSPRRPQSRTNVSSESPIRVPPSQSNDRLRGPLAAPRRAAGARAPG